MAISERTKYIVCGILLIILGGVLLLNNAQKPEQSQEIEVAPADAVDAEAPTEAPADTSTDDNQVSVQEDSSATNSTYDADWQREESRLERSFSWLEDELKIAERTEELKIYRAYTKRLSQCPNGNWKCLEEIRWQLDDFAFAMKSVL